MAHAPSTSAGLSAMGWLMRLLSSYDSYCYHYFLFALQQCPGAADKIRISPVLGVTHRQGDMVLVQRFCNLNSRENKQWEKIQQSRKRRSALPGMEAWERRMFCCYPWTRELNEMHLGQAWNSDFDSFTTFEECFVKDQPCQKAERSGTTTTGAKQPCQDRQGANYCLWGAVLCPKQTVLRPVPALASWWKYV